jgi:Mg2+ and Co2+ transporter CorA
MWTDDVERVLAEDWLGDLPARPIEDIRAMRDEVRAVEDKVSYLRRIIQGRADIVAADLRRRAEGGSPIDLDTLIEQLPGILSDKGGGPGGPGRLPSGLLAPDDASLTAEIDQVAGPDVLGHLADLPDEGVAALAQAIGELERRTSAARRGLFGRIDTLNGELARRYGSGEADVAALLDR